MFDELDSESSFEIGMLAIVFLLIIMWAYSFIDFVKKDQIYKKQKQEQRRT